MYLRRLHIQNLKLFRDLELDFTNADGTHRQWTVLLGRNGRGKTTLLQAIALAAVGSRRANGLAGPFLGSLADRRTTGSQDLSISAAFGLPRVPHRRQQRELPGLPDSIRETTLEVELKLTDDGGDLVGSSRYPSHPHIEDPLSTARGRELPFWFVAAYGVSRHIHALAGKPDLSRPSIQRLVPIFRPEPLVGLGYVTLFDDAKTSQFNSFLSRVISQHPFITPDINRLEVRGRGGVRSQKELLEKERIYYRSGQQEMAIPAGWLSHGYQSTLAWLGDLIGQYLLEIDKPGLEPKHMTGLVLIDEIDLYLHPTWQRGFIKALSTVFPNLQFIATTHSPALLTALKPEELVLLEEDPDTGDIVRRAHTDDPRLMTGSEIYDEFFEVPTLRDNEIAKKLRDHRFLATNPYRTDHEAADLQRLRHELAQEFPDLDLLSPVPREPLPSSRDEA